MLILFSTNALKIMVNRLNNNRVFITETTHFDSSDCSRSGSLITTAMTLDQYLKHRNVIKVLARIQPSFGANWRKQQHVEFHVVSLCWTKHGGSLFNGSMRLQQVIRNHFPVKIRSKSDGKAFQVSSAIC